MLENSAKRSRFLLILHGFVHKMTSVARAVLMEKAFLEPFFAYFYKIWAFFGYFYLSKLFTVKVVIFALMTIARKIMMVISPILTIQNAMESFKILPSEVTKPNVGLKNGKEIVGYFT